MRAFYFVLLAAMLLLRGTAPADEGNPRIDYKEFRDLVIATEETRSEHRVSEAEFLRMAAKKGTIILDTRSKAKFDKIHVKGAVHLNFSDFTEASLAKLIPDKKTRILIYCNNNFDGETNYLTRKARPLALNIPTFLNLHGYGYKNVFELKPLLDIKATKIPFEGTAVKSDEAKR